MAGRFCETKVKLCSKVRFLQRKATAADLDIMQVRSPNQIPSSFIFQCSSMIINDNSVPLKEQKSTCATTLLEHQDASGSSSRQSHWWSFSKCLKLQDLCGWKCGIQADKPYSSSFWDAMGGYGMPSVVYCLIAPLCLRHNEHKPHDHYDGTRQWSAQCLQPPRQTIASKERLNKLGIWIRLSCPLGCIRSAPSTTS